MHLSDTFATLLPHSSTRGPRTLRTGGFGPPSPYASPFLCTNGRVNKEFIIRTTKAAQGSQVWGQAHTKGESENRERERERRVSVLAKRRTKRKSLKITNISSFGSSAVRWNELRTRDDRRRRRGEELAKRRGGRHKPDTPERRAF